MKIINSPCRLFTRGLRRNDEKNPKDLIRSLKKVERRGSPKGNKVLHAWLSWRERGESVAFRAVQACWKKIRCPPDRSARHPTSRRASYPEPSRIGGLALSHKSKCQSLGLRHAATCLRLYVQLCVKVFSLTLCIWGCQFPYSFFHCCFLLYFWIQTAASEVGWRRQG